MSAVSAPALGATLRELRQRRGLSQRDLAAAAGIDRTYVSYVETSGRTPSPTTLAALATALGLNAGERAVLLVTAAGLSRDDLWDALFAWPDDDKESHP